MALLKTSADIGLLPESSANIMEDIRMTRDVKEINVTGINITELQGEKRFRLQLEQKILLFVIILKVFRWKGNSRIANIRN